MEIFGGVRRQNSDDVTIGALAKGINPIKAIPFVGDVLEGVGLTPRRRRRGKPDNITFSSPFLRAS